MPGLKKKKDPLLGAAVVKTVLLRAGVRGGTSQLYEGLLRDLAVTDAEVEGYLACHQGEVDEAIRGRGRR